MNAISTSEKKRKRIDRELFPINQSINLFNHSRSFLEKNNNTNCGLLLSNYRDIHLYVFRVRVNMYLSFAVVCSEHVSQRRNFVCGHQLYCNIFIGEKKIKQSWLRIK